MMYDMQQHQQQSVDEFPGIPTSALLDQLAKITRTVAHRSSAPTLDPQQIMALQLQQYQQHHHQQPQPLFVPEQQQQQPQQPQPKPQVWQQAPAIVRQPPPPAVAAPVHRKQAVTHALVDNNGDVYFSACGRSDHTCRYYPHPRLDKPGCSTAPPIDPKVLHISDLRTDSDDQEEEEEEDSRPDIKQIMGDQLKERGIPFKEIRVNESGYAEVYFGSHGDATAAQHFLQEKEYNVNFKRLKERYHNGRK
jgi:hypothetical protein